MLQTVSSQCKPHTTVPNTALVQYTGTYNTYEDQHLARETMAPSITLGGNPLNVTDQHYSPLLCEVIHRYTSNVVCDVRSFLTSFEATLIKCIAPMKNDHTIFDACIINRTQQSVIPPTVCVRGRDGQGGTCSSEARYFLKFSGGWFAMNKAEDRRRVVALSHLIGVGVYYLCLNTTNIIHFWTDDLNYTVYSCCNILIISLAMFKMVILRIHRFELADIVAYAEKHFWRSDYDSDEQLIFAKCQKFCKFCTIVVYFLPPGSMSGYVTSPIISNIGRNKSERELPIRMLVNWPISETPYFEILFTFQAIGVLIIGVAYVASDYFLCIMNMHVVCQFRILQHRMMNFWTAGNKGTDPEKYADQCIAVLRKYVSHHQSLIEFCEKLEHVFTFSTLWHVVVFSLLVGLDGYEILLSDADVLLRSIFVFHIIGSSVHLVIFSYCCHGLMEESTNICTTIYSGLWATLPMDENGRSLRSNVRMIMIRSMKPCCLTAGGFFPVSLETATTLLSSAVSYFTLMRNSLIRNEE